MATFCQLCFEQRLPFSSWRGETPKKFEKIWGQVKLDHFPQKIGVKIPKLFEVSATSDRFRR